MYAQPRNHVANVSAAAHRSRCFFPVQVVLANYWAPQYAIKAMATTPMIEKGFLWDAMNWATRAFQNGLDDPIERVKYSDIAYVRIANSFANNVRK